MKRISTLLLMAVSGLVYAQDTTTYNMIAVGTGSNLHYHLEDSTELASTTLAVGGGKGLFIYYADSLLYGILDGISGRDLYQINPFDGTSTLIHDFSLSHIHTADIGPNGIVYAVNGNNNGTPGQVLKYDMIGGTESPFFVTGAAGGGNARAIEFNPVDSSLYTYEAFSDQLWVYDLATDVETMSATTGMNDEIHGAFYDKVNDIFHISAYGGEMYTTDNSYLNGTMYLNATTKMDLCQLEYTLRSDTNYYQWCPGTDSTMISHIYGANSFMWYLDGVAQPTWTNDTIWAVDAGVYSCIFEIGSTGNYFWSEGINLDLFTVPNVNISGDTLLCGSGATGTLTGANPGMGTVQWYQNGAPLAGETSQTLNINSAGTYNQLKTNMNGCSDSSATSFVVVADPTDITVSISSAGGDTEICPGDTIVLTGETGMVQWSLDGGILAGETNATLNATMAGNYNQTLTLVSGCADSAATAFAITVDPTCGAGIDANDVSLDVFPNPVQDQLNIQSTDAISMIHVLDISGKTVFVDQSVLSSNYIIDMSAFEQGAYIVKVQIGEQTLIRKIVK